MNTFAKSNTARNPDPLGTPGDKATLTGYACAGPGCGSIAGQRAGIRRAFDGHDLPIVTADQDSRVDRLRGHLGSLAAGSTVVVHNIAILGPDPAAVLDALSAAEAADVTLVVMEAAESPLKPHSAATRLLRASLTQSAAALDRAVRAATPDLGPPHTRRGRPRALDDDDRRRVATAPPAESAADLAAELDVSVSTIMRERRRVREAA